MRNTAATRAKKSGDGQGEPKHRESEAQLDQSKVLLSEALERMLSGQPPPYGRTWTTCLKIKRFLTKTK